MTTQNPRTRKQVLYCIFLAVMGLVLRTDAFARVCHFDTVIRAQENPEAFLMRAVDVAFQGKVVAKWEKVEQLLGMEPRVIKIELIFRIEAVQKGNLPVNSTVEVEGSTEGCECIKDFDVGKSYRVLALEPEDDSDALRLHYCRFNYAVEGPVARGLDDE